MKFTLTVLLFISCTLVSRSQNCLSYESRFYDGAAGILNEIPSIDRYLSCGEDLIEFRLSINTFDSMDATGKRTRYKITYDTIACFYLDVKNKRYYQIDTFLLRHKVIGSGRFSEKPSGTSLPDTSDNLEDDFVENSVRDSVMEEGKVKVADFRLVDSVNGHDLKLIVMFRDDANFTSAFAMTSHFGAQKTWKPVAYFYEDITAGVAYLARLERYEKPSQEAVDTFMAIRRTITGLKE